MGATIPYAEAKESDFDLYMNVHFKSVYFLTQKLLPLINDAGRIINISSGTTKSSVPGYSLYSPMKGAVEVFSKGLRLGSKSVASLYCSSNLSFNICSITAIESVSK